MSEALATPSIKAYAASFTMSERIRAETSPAPSTTTDVSLSSCSNMEMHAAWAADEVCRPGAISITDTSESGGTKPNPQTRFGCVHHDASSVVLWVSAFARMGTDGEA